MNFMLHFYLKPLCNNGADLRFSNFNLQKLIAIVFRLKTVLLRCFIQLQRHRYYFH